MTAAIGIDVGGSQLRVAAVDAFGLVMTCYRRARIGVDRYDALIDWLATQVSRLRADAGPDGPLCVGLAVPGTLDDSRRTVVRATNLDMIEQRAIAEELALRIGQSVTLFTDAEAATWAEYRALAMEIRRFVHLRLGTGIGCGVVVDGKLERTDMRRSTHWELLIVDDGPNAPPCPCGLRGCLEAVASGAALTKRTAQAGCGKELTDLEGAWRRGDGAARAIVDAASKALATAIQKIATQLHPEVIGVGGGVAEALPSLLGETRLHLEHYWVPYGGSGVSETAPTFANPRGLKPAAHYTKSDYALKLAARNTATEYVRGPATRNATGESADANVPAATCRPSSIVVTSSALGDEAGVIGAALLAIEE